MKSSKLKRKPWNTVDDIGKWHLQQEFFYKIWNKRVHVCESCGVRLGNEMKSYMFDHLLEKSSYPEFEYEEWNIFICCRSCHGLKTQGHPTEIHKKAINNVSIKYGN